MSKNSFYTRYNRPPSVKTVLDTETCFVSQSEADMCCLQNQLRRYGEDGLVAKMQLLQDKFGYADCTKVGTFADLQNRVRRGVEYFEALPSEIRARFNHRPELFYDFIEKNREQAVKEGFVKDTVVVDDLVEKTVDTGLSQKVDANVNPIDNVENTPQSDVP